MVRHRYHVYNLDKCSWFSWFRGSWYISRFPSNKLFVNDVNVSTSILSMSMSVNVP